MLPQNAENLESIEPSAPRCFVQFRFIAELMHKYHGRALHRVRPLADGRGGALDKRRHALARLFWLSNVEHDGIPPPRRVAASGTLCVRAHCAGQHHASAPKNMAMIKAMAK